MTPAWTVLRLGLLTLLLLLSGCADGELRPLPSSPALSFDEIKQRVSRLRELSFQQDVSLETKTMEEIQTLLERSLSQEDGNGAAVHLERLYRRLGLLSESEDLPKALLDLRLLQKAVHYDSHRRTIIVPEGPLGPTLRLPRSPWRLEGDTIKQLLLAHTLTHTLQEQHFHWQEKLKHSSTIDMGLALRALAKGDAALVGLAYLTGDPRENKEKFLDGIKELTRLAEQMQRELPHLPELLRQEVAFQYVQGSQFVLWAHTLKGWEGVNRLFSNPPLSTKQLLHPEKYYVRREDPLWITPWSLIRQFASQKVIDETLGEFLIQLLLSRTLSKEEAAQAAGGWAGDNLLAFQQGEDLIVSWVTAWEDREQALEFYTSYRRALERRHGFFLEPSSASSDTLTAPPGSGRPLLLQMRGNFVFFLDGIPPPRSVAIADSLWSELETGTEPRPLELVKRQRQSPVVRR